MTTIKKTLTAADFDNNDIHRPLTNEDIAQINPQAAVDKSAGAVEDDVGAEEGVDRDYPYEEPLPHNVTPLPIETSHDLSPEHILRLAFDNKLTNMVICGEDEDGHEYVFHTSTNPAESMFVLQRALHILQLRMDRSMTERYAAGD